MHEDEYYLHQNKVNKTYATNNQTLINKDIVNLNNQPKKKISGLVIRLAIMGERKCGKTALINCFLKKEFSLDKQDTILNIYAKKITISQYPVTLILYEISEDPSDRALLTKVMKDVHAVLICYSLEDSSTYFNSTMLNESLEILTELDKSIPLFLVGCKYDLVQEKVVNELNIYDNINEGTFTEIGKQIKEYIDNKRNELQLNINGYYVTSALFNINVDKVFNDAIKTIAMPYVMMHIENNMKRGQRVYNNNDNAYRNVFKGGNVANVDEKGCVMF